MGLLDDAIREHLELKKRHGASSDELAAKEAEAFGPARREPVEREPIEPEVEAPPLAAEAEEPYGDEEPYADEGDATRLLEPEPAAAEDELEPGEAPVSRDLPEPELEPHDLPEPDRQPLQPEAEELEAEPEPPQPEAEELEAEPEPRAAEAAGTAPESDLLEPVPEPPRAPEAEPADVAPPRRGDTPPQGMPAVERDPADEIFPEEPAASEDEEGGDEEDVLEETPDFLQETPEHDRLWFEQKPPRDFDFDDD